MTRQKVKTKNRLAHVTEAVLIFFTAGSLSNIAVVFAAPPTVAPQNNYLIFFDREETVVTPEAHRLVEIIVEALSKRPAARVEIIGHDDTALPPDLNLALSYRRAKEVAAEIVKMGVDSNRVYVGAVGADALLVPTARGVSEPQNRNVEVLLAPLDSPLSLRTSRVYRP